MGKNLNKFALLIKKIPITNNVHLRHNKVHFYIKNIFMSTSCHIRKPKKHAF